MNGKNFIAEVLKSVKINKLNVNSICIIYVLDK